MKKRTFNKICKKYLDDWGNPRFYWAYRHLSAKELTEVCKFTQDAIDRFYL